jgi:anti-sigma factor ChrR (cupin superfamily)
MNTEHDCFCDLAPLYTLDVLSEQERRLVEEQLAECPELAAELIELETAVAAIAYSVPPQSPAPGLKDRLFQRIGVEMPQPIPYETPAPVEQAIRSQDLVWKPYRGIPGVMIARLHVDRAKRQMSALLRANAGVRYPLHRHTTAEEILMLEGDLIVGDRVYGAGDYIRSEFGSLHAPETRTGCTFFIRASLDNEILETLASQ